MLINVTQEDIDKGEASHCSRCPVALALIRMGHEEVRVGGSSFTTKTIYAHLPDTAIAWIVSFDLGSKGLPFTFTVEPKNFE